MEVPLIHYTRRVVQCQGICLRYMIHHSKFIMDSVAASIITKWDGDIGKLGFLKYDVTNISSLSKV